MNWENIDLSSEEVHVPDKLKSKQNLDTIHEQNERKRVSQLEKLLSRKNDEHRKSYIEIMTKFGELLVKNDKEEIENALLTEDCETFLINFVELSPLQYGINRQRFAGLLRGYIIIQREVKETFVDVDKDTGFQICCWNVKKEKEGFTMSQFSFEAFTFRGGQVCKYRASFGTMAASNEPQKLFIPTTKEKMIAKVREINHAWADQPDLERIASLLHQNTEYKIWRWKDKKCFTFRKDNLVTDFRKNLEEHFVIKSVVPFDPTCEAQYIVGSYVYYLEGKGELSGKRYQWVSNCIYAFDRDLNVKKISQQGELHPEDDVPIPFAVHLKDEIKGKLDAFFALTKGETTSLFSSEEMNFSFDLGLFGCSSSFWTGIIKGFNEYKKLLKVAEMKKAKKLKPAKPVDIYLDFEGESYDTAITIDFTRVVQQSDDSLYPGLSPSIYAMRKFSFENGKIAKVVLFVFVFYEDIPSLYDDFTSSSSKIKNEQEELVQE